MARKLRNVFVTAQHKGGAFKTSLTYVLGNMLATDSHESVIRYDQLRKGRKILFIDLDFQSDLSFHLAKTEDFDGGVYEAIKEGDARPYIIQPNENSNIYLLPASENTAAFDELHFDVLRKKKDHFKLLEKCLEKAVDELEIDTIFIDNSPSLSKLMLYGLSVSFGLPTKCIIPLQLDTRSVGAFKRIKTTISEIKNEVNENIYIEKVVPVVFEKRAKLDNDVLTFFRNNQSIPLSKTELTRMSAAKELIAYGFSESNSKNRNALKMYYNLINELDIEGGRENE